MEYLRITIAFFVTGTWIITGGRKSGVMELVRGAVNDHNFGRECKNDIVVLGVAPWGCVANRQALKKEEVEATFCSEKKFLGHAQKHKT